MSKRSPLCSLVVGALSLVNAGAAFAETVEQVPNPRTRGSWVSDVANVLSSTQTTMIDDTIDALVRENGAEIAVVTVRSTSGQPVKDFAHALFNRWGVGKKGADNGVLVLLSLNDRRIEVETGYGAEGVLPDGKVGDVLDRYAVPSFRAGAYGAGLVDTVTALSVQLREGEPAYSKAARSVGLTTATALGLLALLLSVLLGGFFLWLSRRPKRCPRCDEPMRLLTEQQENVYLDRDQELEETIGALNWQVWRCDDDNETVFVAKSPWFSGFRDCEACGRKTSYSSSRTVQSATYTSTGIERVTTKCRLPRCRHEKSYTNVIPMKVRPTTTHSSSSGWSSSSSSSSSFGGGSSGGGGAGRSW